MNFFERIHPLMEGVEKLTITIVRKEGQLTLGVLPTVKNEAVNKALPMLSLIGTPEELDEAFFNSLSQTKTAVQSTANNLDEIEKAMKSEVDKAKGKSVAKKADKPSPKKATKASDEGAESDDELEEDETTQSQLF